MSNIEESLAKAVELKNQQKYKEAIDLLENLFAKNPDSAIIKETLITVLFDYGGYLNDEWVMDYEGAALAFKRIMEIEPENFRAIYNLGHTFLNLEKMEETLNLYNRALEIKPDYYHCIYSIGYLYEKQGDFTKAIEYYEKALKINPKFTYARQAREDLRRMMMEEEN